MGKYRHSGEWVKVAPTCRQFWVVSQLPGSKRHRTRPPAEGKYGCYVNSGREIISYLDEALGRMPQEEAEKYLGLLKKALSGTLGKKLIDILYRTIQSFSFRLILPPFCVDPAAFPSVLSILFYLALSS